MPCENQTKDQPRESGAKTLFTRTKRNSFIPRSKISISLKSWEQKALSNNTLQNVMNHAKKQGLLSALPRLRFYHIPCCISCYALPFTIFFIFSSFFMWALIWLPDLNYLKQAAQLHFFLSFTNEILVHHWLLNHACMYTCNSMVSIYMCYAVPYTCS